jgi:hypothetical protein
MQIAIIYIQQIVSGWDRHRLKIIYDKVFLLIKDCEPNTKNVKPSRFILKLESIIILDNGDKDEWISVM